MFEVKTEEKGFTLIFNGIEIGSSKLSCDAALIGKQLDKLFEKEYNRGASDAQLSKILETE